MHSVTSFLDFKILIFKKILRGAKQSQGGTNAPPAPRERNPGSDYSNTVSKLPSLFFVRFEVTQVIYYT